MDDVYIFLSFVAIVLSPCFVALHSRARGDQEEETQRRRKPQMHPAKTLPNRRAKARSVPAAPALHRLATVPVGAHRVKEAAPSVSRSRRPSPGSVFIPPVRRIASQVGRARHGQNASPSVAKRRQPGGLSVWIRPVRRALTATAISPNQLCRLCRAQIFGNDHEPMVSPRLLFKR